MDSWKAFFDGITITSSLITISSFLIGLTSGYKMGFKSGKKCISIQGDKARGGNTMEGTFGDHGNQNMTIS